MIKHKRDLSIKGNFITDSEKTTHDERQTHTHTMTVTNNKLDNYPFMTEVLKFKYVKPQNFKYRTTVECARKLTHSSVVLLESL